MGLKAKKQKEIKDAVDFFVTSEISQSVESGNMIRLAITTFPEARFAIKYCEENIKEPDALWALKEVILIACD